MQIKFLSLASLAVLFAAVSAAPPPASSQEGATQYVDGPDISDSRRSVPSSGDEATFNARVEAIQNDPEIKNTLDFLIQQISGKLNEGSSPSAQSPNGL
ncbi:uncharacterized protein ATC70_009043 [Mucor velutinosus]|uniref:Uncharacterized protein n=1 Tax=Mucor velutinosus TaxID=708070 RepID=A0AAN7DLJ8_9FUNG|nr:hypothetical protein ATC70_009043 [Mucor velutinosus]